MKIALGMNRFQAERQLRGLELDSDAFLGVPAQL
jgi:hypothetical protein